MTNKEFLSELSKKTGFKIQTTKDMVRTTVYAITDSLVDGEGVNVAGLGSFDVKKRMERIINNPSTGQKMLVPPKLVAIFRPIAALKDKIRNQG